jgi:hypothetical protein
VPAARKLLTWCALLALTVLPVVTGLVHQQRSGWYPESDDATIVLLSGDTFSTDPPLVGMISTGGAHLDDPELHHPGPIELYLLAPLTTFGPGPATGAVVTAALVAVGSVAALAWALHALGGRALAAAGLVTSALVLWGMGGDAPVSVWNPYVVVLPFAAFLACTVVAAAGRSWALVGVVVTGSFVAQTHLSYVGLVGAVTAWVLATTVWRAVRARPHDLRPQRWALLAGVLLWLPPVVDQLRGDPGNLGQIWRALTGGGDGEVVGTDGLAELARVVGVPLAGLRPNGDLVRVLPDAGLSDLVLLAVPWLVLGGLAVLVRWRAPDLSAVVATLAVALAAALVTAGRIPLSDGVLYQYYGLWMWPLAGVFWLVTTWVAWRVLPPGARSRARAVLAPVATRPAGPVVVAGALLGLAALPRPGAWEPWAVQRRIAGDLADAVETRATRNPVVVRFRGATPYLSTGSAVVLARSRHAAEVLVDPGAPTPVFPWREARRYRGETGIDELWVLSGAGQPVPDGAVLVAETSTLTRAERADLIRRRTRAETAVTERGAAPGPRRPESDGERRRVAVATADPLPALADGTLADLAVRGLVTVPGLSPDDLHTLQRLTVLEAEERVAVYLVRG